MNRYISFLTSYVDRICRYVHFLFHRCVHVIMVEDWQPMAIAFAPLSFMGGAVEDPYVSTLS